MIYLKAIDLNLDHAKKQKDDRIKNIVITDSEFSDTVMDHRQVFSLFVSDDFDPTPTCFCGDRRGYWRSHEVVCPNCNQEVSGIWAESQSEDSTELWIGVTEHVPRIMNMKIVATIKEYFQPGSGFCPISWFMSSTYKPSKQIAVIDELKESGFKRGYNNFCDNYIKIVKFLLGLKHYKKRANPSAYQYKMLFAFLSKTKIVAFSDYHPLPKRGMIVIEQTPTGTYKDKIGMSALNSIRMLTGAASKSASMQDSRMGRATIALIDFHNKYLSTCAFNGKAGFVRKTIFGTRTNFSSRCLITGIVEPHDMNEVVLSWSSAISMMQPHLINKLTKRGYSVLAAKNIINDAYNVFSEEVSECIDELLSETATGKLSITLQRNPSMGPESMHITFASVDRDVRNKTNRVSILMVKFFNADFDGDYENIMLTLDIKMEELLEPLQSHNNLFDLKEPGRVTGFLHLTDPLLSSTSLWLDMGMTGDSDLMQELEAESV